MATMSCLKCNNVSTPGDAISCDGCDNTIHYKCLYLSLPTECRSQNMQKYFRASFSLPIIGLNLIYALIITYKLVIYVLMISLTNYKLALSLLLTMYPPAIPIIMTPPSYSHSLPLYHIFLML